MLCLSSYHKDIDHLKEDDVYLDFNSTAPLSEASRTSYLEALDQFWGNSSSQHSMGRAAAGALERARDQLGDVFDVDPRTIRFTSGATEANSWLMKSILKDADLKQQGKTLRVVSAIEHPSILSYGDLFLPVDSTGRVVVDGAESMIKEHSHRVALVSMMSVNNETGVIQPVDEISRI